MSANDALRPPERERRQQEQAAQRSHDRRVLAVVAVAVVVVLVGGGTGLQWWRTDRSPSVPALSGSSSFAPVSVVDGKPLVLGQAAAPVVVQLYEDFHCPHCADFEARMGSAIREQQNAGTIAVELYSMSFIDAGSASAANAMACAAENGFGAAYYQGLFANPTLRWNSRQLGDLAAEVTGSVPQAFTTCVATDAHQDWVHSINAAAQAGGITSTPTVFVDGRLVDEGTLTPASLASMIKTATDE